MGLALLLSPLPKRSGQDYGLREETELVKDDPLHLDLEKHHVSLKHDTQVRYALLPPAFLVSESAKVRGRSDPVWRVVAVEYSTMRDKKKIGVRVRGSQYEKNHSNVEIPTQNALELLSKANDPFTLENLENCYFVARPTKWHWSIDKYCVK